MTKIEFDCWTHPLSKTFSSWDVRADRVISGRWFRNQKAELKRGAQVEDRDDLGSQVQMA
jgi:hypothetical protein